MEFLKPEERLCLWCRNLAFQEGFAYSEATWNSGKLICNEKVFQDQYGDNPFEYPSDLFKILRTAITCPKFELNKDIEKELSNEPLQSSLQRYSA